MNFKIAASSAFLALVLPCAALAFPPPNPDDFRGEISPELHAMRREIAAIKLDNLLKLTPEQAKQILALSQKAQARKDEIDRQRKKTEPNFLKALSAVRDELKAKGEVSPETERRLRLAKGEFDFRELWREFDGLADQAAALLTDEQKAALADFDPKPLTHRGHHRGQTPPPPHGGHNPGMMPPPPPPHGMHGQMPPPPDGGRHPGMMPPPAQPEMYGRRHKRHGPNPMMLMLSKEFEPLLKARAKAK